MKYMYFVLFLFLLIIATSSTNLLGGVSAMKRLRSLGVNPNVPRSELVSVLSTQSTNYLLDLKQTFFEELAATHLIREGDELVSRRCSKSKPLPVKLSEDICSLLFCLKNNSHIPRSVLKNGKRDRSYLEASRAHFQSQNQVPVSSQPTPINALHDVPNQTALSGVMKEINT